MVRQSRYLEHWGEWDFLKYHEVEDNLHPIGTCVEGVRVEFNTPGFRGNTIFAIANTTGNNAPKTNVARSTIERTPQREALLSTIYHLYLLHINSELENLSKKGYSITWAASEANWILSSFVKAPAHNEATYLEDNDLFLSQLSFNKLILTENRETRQLISLKELQEFQHYWTIESESYSSANALLKELKSSKISSLSVLSSILGMQDANIDHIDNVLCGRQYVRLLDEVIDENFQVDCIKIIPEQRRLDMRWLFTKEKYWELITITKDPYYDEYGYGTYLPGENEKCYIQVKKIDLQSQSYYSAISSFDGFFFLDNSEMCQFLLKLIPKFSNNADEQVALSRIIYIIIELFEGKNTDSARLLEFVKWRFERGNNRNITTIINDHLDIMEFVSLLSKANLVKYDTSIWYQHR